MSAETKNDPKKALKHEEKGDQLAAKENFREALAEYIASESLDPTRPEIYEKLIETHKRFEHEWVEQDFTDSLTWTMRKQELLNPQIRWVHETFTVEYQEVKTLIQGLLAAMDPETEVRYMEKILAHGDKAVLPLLHFALSVKSVAQNAPLPETGPEANDLTPPPDPL